MRGNTLEYRRKIVEMYGEGYDEILEERARETKKFNVSDLETLIVNLKEKIKRL